MLHKSRTYNLNVTTEILHEQSLAFHAQSTETLTDPCRSNNVQYGHQARCDRRVIATRRPNKGNSDFRPRDSAMLMTYCAQNSSTLNLGASGWLARGYAIARVFSGTTVELCVTNEWVVLSRPVTGWPSRDLTLRCWFNVIFLLIIFTREWTRLSSRSVKQPSNVSELPVCVAVYCRPTRLLS